MSYGLAIDPGMSNGICLFSWGGFDNGTGGMADGSFKQEGIWQIPKGAQGLRDWIVWQGLQRRGNALHMNFEKQQININRLVVEKFTPRPHESFGLTQKAVEPLRGEGVLIGRDMEEFIDWREPAMQYFMGGADLPEKKKRSRDFLRANGLYITGKQVGRPDADDAISAELHAIAWLRMKRHIPTLMELFGEEE